MENLEYKRQSIRRKYYNYENNGFYFISICCDSYINYLGKIENNKLKRSKMGIVVEKYLLEISRKFNFIKLYEYVIMPNHIHAIIIINNKKQSFGPWKTIDDYAARSGICYYDGRFDGFDSGVGLDNRMNAVLNNRRGAIYRARNNQGRDKSRPYKIIPNNIMNKKSLAKVIRWFKGRTTFEIHQQILKSFKWQRNYYEHIIRNEKSLINISYYIKANPERWHRDRNNRDVLR